MGRRDVIWALVVAVLLVGGGMATSKAVEYHRTNEQVLQALEDDERLLRMHERVATLASSNMDRCLAELKTCHGR